MASLSEIQHQSWQTAEDAGWHDKISRTIEGQCTRLCLIHSEVTEAMEELRTCGTGGYMDGDKPMGFGSELADIIIRVCDLAGETGISLEQEIDRKNAYNRIRADVPARDGGRDHAKKF